MCVNQECHVGQPENSARKPFAVFCDIGNVLVETGRTIQEAAEFADTECERAGFRISPHSFVSAYLAVDKSTTTPHVNHLFGNRSIAMAAIEKVQGTADIRYAGAFLSAYRDYVRRQLVPSPEITRFFRRLAQLENVELGVISDGTVDEQLETLARLEILAYMNPKLVLISEDFGEEKTSTGIFAEALRRARTVPERTLMIGDNMARDVLLPKRLGMRAILFRKYVQSQGEPPGDSKPDFVCDDFDSVLDALLSLLARET